ncbi:MAG: domain containing protein [Fibrobacteres bacterium]|nr:domain containing protein [Fibrobacterota bacterium]
MTLRTAKKKNGKLVSAALLALAAIPLLPSLLNAQCDALPPATDFKAEKVADAPGWPYDIVVDKDLKVYWVERLGAFKVWDPATKVVTTIKQFSVLSADYAGFTDVENGLEGLAFDLNFSSTHWIYVWYTVYAAKGTFAKASLGPTVRLSRFTLKNNNTEVDMASEKPLFEHKIFAQCCHFGGDLKMSKDGLLYLSTGDNINYNYTGTGVARAFDESIIHGDPRNTSSNTNDTRGKILRIKPIPFPDTQTPAIGPGSTYEIPAGNLKETWNTAEKDKVRPEIYSMGHRNPFSISVHPDKPWVAIGEANGDNPEEGDDEINLVTKPGNFGWPFLIGNNQLYIPGFWTNRTDAAKNPASYTNESKFNTGAKTLPPAVGSLYSVKHGGIALPIQCHGVTWGFVDYDPMLNSKVKWPPYLKGKLLVSGYGTTPVRVATLDADGKVTKTENLFNSADFTTDILRATQGPDGAFYVARGDGISFNASSVCKIYKVSYTGSCAPVSARPSGEQIAKRAALRPKIANLGTTEVTLPAGMARVAAYDIRGAKVWEAERGAQEGDVVRNLPGSLSKGMLELRYTAE